MPNSSNTAAVRKSRATISPTVTEVKRSDISNLQSRQANREAPATSNSTVAAAGRGRYDPRHMSAEMEEVLRRSAIFRRLTPEDRHRLASVARVRMYEKGDLLFTEGDSSDVMYTVVTGRVKVFKMTPRGTDVILEIFGPGDPVGAVAVYESRPYPASAVALEATACLALPRRDFFSLLETYPTLVRGLLVGLTHRIVELTNRIMNTTSSLSEVAVLAKS